MSGMAYPDARAIEHHDRLTGFRDRDELMADLTAALEPQSAPSILAVFDLFGMNEFRLLHGERASDELTGRLAGTFARVVRSKGSCYRPRRDEFCVLLAGRIDEDDLTDLLPEAARALWDVAEGSLVGSWYGACVLPDEASDPLEALMIADERLLTRGENRAPRERRKR